MSNPKDYKFKESSLELFDIDPEEKDPEPEELPKPTPAQLRFLHLLSRNRLVLRSWPAPGFDVTDAEGNFCPIGFSSRKVADSVVLREWVDMIRFEKTRAVYKLSETGREILAQLCTHTHYDDRKTETLAGKLICTECVFQIPCRSKQPRKHGANRFDYMFRAMCDDCTDYVQSNWWNLGRRKS
jgi:hypothetical protein